MRIVNATYNAGESSERMVGMRVRSIRQEQNISLSSLANSIGVSAQKLHSYEAGLTVLPSSVLSRISSVLGVNLDAFPSDTAAKQGEPSGLRGVV